MVRVHFCTLAMKCVSETEQIMELYTYNTCIYRMWTDVRSVWVVHDVRTWPSVCFPLSVTCPVVGRYIRCLRTVIDRVAALFVFRRGGYGQTSCPCPRSAVKMLDNNTLAITYRTVSSVRIRTYLCLGIMVACPGLVVLWGGGGRRVRTFC